MTEARAMPEFSRILQLDAADRGGEGAQLRASEAECAALSERLQLQQLADLCADVSWRRTAAGLVRLNVDFSANVVQSCVVSLDAVPAVVTDHFTLLCDGGPVQGSAADVEGEVFVDPFAEDPIEPLLDGRIDVGELIAQHLSLALDPYPRAQGIEIGSVIEEAGAAGIGVYEETADGRLEGADAGGDTDGEEASPFAVLSRLRAKG